VASEATHRLVSPIDCEARPQVVVEGQGSLGSGASEGRSKLHLIMAARTALLALVLGRLSRLVECALVDVHVAGCTGIFRRAEDRANPTECAWCEGL
jgi:hypothetical protein